MMVHMTVAKEGSGEFESPCWQVRTFYGPSGKAECYWWTKETLFRRVLLSDIPCKSCGRTEAFILFINIPLWSQFASLYPFSSSEWKFPGKPFLWMECVRFVPWEKNKNTQQETTTPKSFPWNVAGRSGSCLSFFKARWRFQRAGFQ